MKWIEALKEFNKDKNEWCIPKKGTEGYTKTKELMKGNKQKAGSKIAEAIKAKKARDEYIKTVDKDRSDKIYEEGVKKYGSVQGYLDALLNRLPVPPAFSTKGKGGKRGRK